MTDASLEWYQAQQLAFLDCCHAMYMAICPRLTAPCPVPNAASTTLFRFAHDVYDPCRLRNFLSSAASSSAWHLSTNSSSHEMRSRNFGWEAGISGDCEARGAEDSTDTSHVQEVKEAQERKC